MGSNPKSAWKSPWMRQGWVWAVRRWENGRWMPIFLTKDKGQAKAFLRGRWRRLTIDRVPYRGIRTGINKRPG